MAGESQLGVAVVPIRATLEKLDSDLSEARKKIDGALGRTADRIKTDYLNLGGKVATGVGLATSALVGLGAAGAGVLSRLAVDALPLQGVKDAFAGITGNADEMLEVLQRGSLGMVRDTDLMMSYNSAAQLVSKTFADQLPDAMGYLAKVSAATGEDMGFMIDSLVKGVGRLSPMILDNLGIQVQLSDATARAAEMFGVEEDALTKTQIQAGMMDVVLQKLAENTADMPEVAGTARQRWAALGVTFQNVKDNIGLALLPALEAIMTPIGELVEKHGPQLVALFEQDVIPVIERVAEAFGMLLSGDAQGALEHLFGPEIAGQIMSFAQTVSDFVNNTLIPFVSEHAEDFKAALTAIGAALAGAGIYAAIMGIVGALGFLANPITWIIAAVAVLAAAWAGNWGGIRTTLTDFWEGTAQPILDRLRAWLEDNIPKALQFLSDVWQNVLQPALEAVWGFIQADLVPLLEALAELVGAVLYKAGQALAGLWQNVLAPALETVWKWLGDTAKVIGEKLQPVLEWLRDKALPPIERALAAVSSAFSKVTDKVKSLADRIRNLKLPDWLTPGSPTPLEIGLRGIAAAMGDLSRLAVPRLQAELELLPAAGLERAIGSAPAQTHYHIEANYRYQDERSLREDIRLMQMLGAAT